MNKYLRLGKTTIIIIALFFSCMAANGQSLSTAKELYNNKMYKNAITELNKVIKSLGPKAKGKAIEEAEGIKVLCTIALRQANVDNSVASFQKKYPSSNLIPQIKFSYANYLFEKEKYSQAIKNYNSVNTKQISNSDKETLTFRKAFSLFKIGNNDEATSLFDELIADPQTSPSNINASKYYKGYIAYTNKNFKDAIKLFGESSGDARFAQLSQYYILDSKFMLKDYDFVIEKGTTLLKSHIDSKEDIEEEKKSTIQKMARLVSESYYLKNDIKRASEYFDYYAKGKTNLSREDYLYGGTIAYEAGNYQSATEFLPQACNIEDSLSQNANYRLAKSYINLKNKNKALEAFKNASELDYDPQIKEDSQYNYAKLFFDLTGQITEIENYLKTNKPNSKKSDEIYGYIAYNALLNNDYTQAIESFGKIRNKTENDITNLKKAYLLKGNSLLEGGAYDLAATYLNNAIQGGANNNITSLANLLLSECYYRRENYNQSLAILNNLKSNVSFSHSEEYPLVFLNSAYNYFKLKRFEEAESNFEEYINRTNSQHNTDNSLAEEAKIRIADCRFMRRDYAMAAKMYRKIALESTVSPVERDLYPNLQQAISQGLMGNKADKIATLRHITSPEYKLNKRYSEAVYELGRTQVENNEEGAAITTFVKLIYNPTDSLYFTRAVSEVALINVNKQNYSQAIEYYEKLLDYAPNSAEGVAALEALESIYSTIGKPDEFYEYIRQHKFTQVKSEEEQEVIFFNAAREIYLVDNYEKAIPALESYLQRFPNGENKVSALYYTAECYNKLGNYRKSASYYAKVIDEGNSSYLENATIKFADISLANEQYEDALNAYEKIEFGAKTNSNKVAALMGQIKAYFAQRDFENSISKCNDLYVNGLSNNLIKEKEFALYYKAKSLIGQGYIDDALSLINKVAENPNSEYGAECNYLRIKNRFDEGQFKEVEDLVFEFSDTKTQQNYWLAKSFVILGDSYLERGNTKQALATFKSIRDNYKGNDDVKEGVELKINQIENR